MKLLFSLLYCCLSSIVFSQHSIDSLNSNRAIHRTWGGDKIRFLSQQDPEMIQKGLYYFNYSFEAKLKDCSSCDVDLNQLINRDLFNVAEFESARKNDERFEFVFKEYHITLHSKQELENYFGESITSIINGVSMHVSFPSFDFSDLTTKKLEQYKSLCRFFILNYKASYKERIGFPNYRILSLEEVKNLSQEEIDTFSSNPNSFEVRIN